MAGTSPSLGLSYDDGYWAFPTGRNCIGIACLKCPSCSSKVGRESFTADSKGDEYYVCPECERELVHQMGYGKVLLMSVIGLPIVYFFMDLLLAMLIGPFLGETSAFGIDLLSAVSVAVSIVVTIWFIAYSIRLVVK